MNIVRERYLHHSSRNKIFGCTNLTLRHGESSFGEARLRELRNARSNVAACAAKFYKKFLVAIDFSIAFQRMTIDASRAVECCVAWEERRKRQELCMKHRVRL